MDVSIERPVESDAGEIQRLFEVVIADAFHQDGLHDPDGVAHEVQKQMGFLQRDFHTHGSDVFFLIARAHTQIVGTIAISASNELIRKHTPIDVSNVPEITTVYVLPAFQGKGIGSLLFNAILKELQSRNTDTVCLDGGYRKSQSFWIKKLGIPDVVLPDYWGKGLDHMIWIRHLRDLGKKDS